jgi:hypothetical protein
LSYCRNSYEQGNHDANRYPGPFHVSNILNHGIWLTLYQKQMEQTGDLLSSRDKGEIDADEMLFWCDRICCVENCPFKKVFSGYQ